jgi:hypothetical protein
MSKYQVGARWDMRILQSGTVTFEIVTISKVTQEGNVIIDSNPPLVFRPDGSELRPIDPTVQRLLIMQH